MFPMPRTDIDQLSRLINAGHPCVMLPTFEEDHAMAVIRTVADELRRHALAWTVTRGLHDALIREETNIPDTTHPAGALTHLAKHTPARSIIVMLDLAGHLKDDRTLRALRELFDHLQRVESTLILIDPTDDFPASVCAVAARLDLTLPGELELEQIVKNTLRSAHGQSAINVQLTREDFAAIVQNLSGLSRRQARQAVIETISDDRRIDASDIKRIIDFKRRALRSVGVLEPVETLITLDQVGGLENLKKWLKLRENAMSEEAIEFGIEPPRGVLMLGVQGGGKSLSAKAVATAWKRPLVRMDVGALFDRFIGESEKRLREALRQAAMMSPVILWIDEIEKAFASAASQSVDGGLSKRMFGTLLTWMQEHTKPVFVIATANDVSVLPPELLRKGRFDEIFFIDLPQTEARKQIFEIHLRKRDRDPELFDLDELAAEAEGYNGAEIEQAIKSSIYDSFSRNTLLSTSMIVNALRASPPLSVTMAEKMDALREWAIGRCVMAD